MDVSSRVVGVEVLALTKGMVHGVVGHVADVKRDDSLGSEV